MNARSRVLVEPQRRIAAARAKNGEHAGEPIDMKNPASAGLG